jgi:hypothetical protein
MRPECRRKARLSSTCCSRRRCADTSCGGRCAVRSTRSSRYPAGWATLLHRSRAHALARLARRYLAGHGPADARDLAKWAGLTLGDARAAFQAINADLTDVAGLTDLAGLVDLAERAAPDAPRSRRQPRLLGPFDPLLLGWSDREPFVGPHRVVTTNGLFRAVALADGRVVGTWGLSGTTLTVTLLEQVEAAVVTALRRDAADVPRFLGLPDSSTVTVTWP